MKYDDMYPSKYLKASDLAGKNITVRISHIQIEELKSKRGSENKPVMYFQGKQKGMVLNKTNAKNIAAAYGDDTENWTNCELILFEALVDMQGETVPALRVRTPQPKDKPVQVKPIQPAPIDEKQEDWLGLARQEYEMSDDIPF